MLAQAHKDAVASTMTVIADELGHARRGKAGSGGTEAGHITWLGFDHYSSRPVVAVARTDAKGAPYSQFMGVGTAGDPALHSHMLVPSVVMTDTGRVGALDLDTMAGKTHSWGAIYQAFLATNLKRLGVDVALDERTGAARLTAVPDKPMMSRLTQSVRLVSSGIATCCLSWDNEIGHVALCHLVLA